MKSYTVFELENAKFSFRWPGWNEVYIYDSSLNNVGKFLVNVTDYEYVRKQCLELFEKPTNIINHLYLLGDL